jgi:shikimate dehydrogenase
MQNAGMVALGLNWRYLACDVYPEQLRQAIAGAKAMNFIGLNLTVPHKLLAVDMVDVLDESARKWGAVNMILFEARDGKGIWHPLRDLAGPPAEIRTNGFNTDADAIARALKEDLGIVLSGAKVLLLGVGGAGRTAALKLASEEVGELFIVNRTRAKAEAVRDEIRNHWPVVKVAVGYPPGTVDLVLNATSLGLTKSDPLPFDESEFSLHRTTAVYDMIYRPAETLLLQQAKAAGRRVANGLGMLLYQGAKALEIWTGQEAPIQIMRQALERNVYGV